MEEPLLKISELKVSFRSENSCTTAVNGISLEVNRGEILALVGESGSGKSVTALSILRLLPSPPAQYDQGNIFFSSLHGHLDLLRQDKKMLRKIRGKEIAMIFQEPMTSLNPVFTCGEQVQEAILAHENISARAARRRAIELFEKVLLPNPSDIFRRYPHQLSGGQKQRVMIAMAISCQPSLLICDEPTTALDVTVQKTILDLIRALQKQEGMGVIFITHDLGVVAEIADRAAVMYRGEIVEKGSAASLLSQPSHPYTRGLLACRPALHEKGGRLPVVSDFLNPQEDSHARVASAHGEKQPPINTDKLFIEVNDLSVRFPTRKNFLGTPVEFMNAVDDVSFIINKGETVGLVGESGCGKTTLGRTLLRLIEPSAGSIRMQGKELKDIPREQLRDFRKEIQLIFQDPYSSLNPRMPVGEAIEEPMKVHRLHGNARQRREKVAELLEKVNLHPDFYRRYPHEFSGGQRQRIVIARALGLEPSFLVCDESVSALDVSVQAQVLNLFNDLRREFKFTSIFISHDLSVVRYISDRIMVMHQGKIVESGDAEQVYLHPVSEYTKRLLKSIPGLSSPV